MNTKKEAASPLLTGQPMPSGSGVCRAMLRGRPSSLEGDDASLARPACRPALDPGDLYGPWGRWCGQARACPGDRRGTPITTYRQDQKAQNYMIQISTVSGDCQTWLNAYLDACGHNGGKPLIGPHLQHLRRCNP